VFAYAKAYTLSAYEAKAEKEDERCFYKLRVLMKIVKLLNMYVVNSGHIGYVYR